MFPRKRVIRFFVLALALGLTSFSMKGSATNVIIECDYYSDATHTTMVGSYIRVCNGHTNTSGTVTPYKVCITEGC